MYDDMYANVHKYDYVNVYADVHNYVYVYKVKGEDTSESLIMYSNL